MSLITRPSVGVIGRPSHVVETSVSFPLSEGLPGLLQTADRVFMTCYSVPLGTGARSIMLSEIRFESEFYFIFDKIHKFSVGFFIKNHIC